MSKGSNKDHLPWEVWDNHVIDARGRNDGCVAFNVGPETAQFVVESVNSREDLLEAIEKLEGTVKWHEGRDKFLVKILGWYVKCTCAKSVPRVRLTWARPTCHECLPPTPDLGTIEITEDDIIEEADA